MSGCDLGGFFCMDVCNSCINYCVE
jgi:hypothetical protein